MRIANLDGRLTLLSPDGRGLDVHDSSAGLFDSDPQSAYVRWDELAIWAGERQSGEYAEVDSSLLGPPVPRPRQIFAIAANYKAHAAEAGVVMPNTPVIFTKFPSCLTGPFAEIPLPDGRVDWEVEMVVVIGKESARVRREEAWNVVAGVTVGQDLSERLMQKIGPLPQLSMAKSLNGFGPIGPSVVSVDEFPNPDDLELGCAVNGVQMQLSRTSDLVFGVPELIEHITSVCTVFPGDLIFTGTPEGVGATRTPPKFLSEGDVLTTFVEGVGEMRNVMVAEPHSIREMV